MQHVMPQLNYKRLTTPLEPDIVAALRAGDHVLLSGTVYTARDAAHKRLVELAADGRPMPFPIRGSVIYYVGPTPAPPGRVIGSAGPTTSSRMDAYAPTLISLGQLGMIGKGDRSPDVVAAMRTHGAVYFGAIGGAGALLSERIMDAEIIAYADLGPEAIHRLVVKDFPLTVLIDSHGQNLYKIGRTNGLR